MSLAFPALGLSEALLRAVAQRGYGEPTPIQAAALPPALLGRDLIGCARTGSGKTAAYALAVLQRLEGGARAGAGRTRALVLVPTRELAVQAGEEFRALARHLAVRPRVAVVHGGVSANPQMIGLRGGAEVVVATPGRLLDLLERRALRLDDVALLVLDEADRLLEAGFADELERITRMLPAHRQGLFFSATFPPAVRLLAAALSRDPVQVDVPAPDSAEAPAIAQRALEVDAAQRTRLLHHLVETEHWARVLVFVATRHGSEQVAEALRRAGVAAAAFHGDLAQGARSRVLADFNAGTLRVMLATDIAARGLHVPGLPVVLNFDLPRSAADYTHRIGRTARAGATGLAVSFVSAATEAHFRLIETRQGRRVPRERIAGFEPRDAAVPTVPGGGGVKGRGRSKKDRLREAALRSG
ncbi:MAG: DEAD/DEAH box helicase [Burkholderiales bacterium]|nr:MAG: DEAD/DEAH box helicase [Burkholderiales bacterium]